MEPAWRQHGRGRGRGQPRGPAGAASDVAAVRPQRDGRADSGAWAGRGRGVSTVTTATKAERPVSQTKG